MSTFDSVKQISVEQFQYDLPDERIAKYPLEQRDQSKLLLWKSGNISDFHFYDLPRLLPEHSLLVFNNTKVIRARLFFRKETGALIEIFVLDPNDPADYAQNFQQTECCRWNCIVGNLKKWKNGVLKATVNIGGTEIEFSAENICESGNGRTIEFRWSNSSFTFSEVLESAGNMPIPPYLNRETEESDLTRYQTVYSKIKGSVAAPTAGLHFTEKVFEGLKKNGIETAELTLHVGAGTFQPVKAHTIAGHDMHTEHIVVERSFVEQILAHKGPIIAVGTTSIRSLESLYWLGNRMFNNPKAELADLKTDQWEPYQDGKTCTKEEALNALINYMDDKKIRQIHAATQIIIVPGYSFKIVEGMVTNFHQPQSTLLLLISAFLGDEWRTIYNHALANGYRFLSYGDSNLYLRS